MPRKGRNSLSEKVYRSLLRDLSAGVIVPSERLAEERLADIYGVSRTPVREALARLLADGLLERHADGLYPYRPRLDQLADLFELRIILEARGIQRVIAGNSTHDLVAIQRELDLWRTRLADPPDPGPELVVADEQFHATLLAAAGNASLVEALATVHARVRPLRALDVPAADRIATMTTEHIRIAEHLLAGELDTALVALLAHITGSRDHVLARARQALAFTRLGQAVRD
ncbi:GntR family transcriptional regulator [Nocardia sp. BMG111209]|uniref:GntR family transcriptional regulator n=1 Tax=Nocardia sp. BMG111209 TaxID=1160137 RepID=UPI000380C3AE|nr:GntR family transcriptional regulator [Nocardia sp. BMG111209]